VSAGWRVSSSKSRSLRAPARARARPRARRALTRRWQAALAWGFARVPSQAGAGLWQLLLESARRNGLTACEPRQLVALAWACASRARLTSRPARAARRAEGDAEWSEESEDEKAAQGEGGGARGMAQVGTDAGPWDSGDAGAFAFERWAQSRTAPKQRVDSQSSEVRARPSASPRAVRGARA
jgi:hypothetical protein